MHTKESIHQLLDRNPNAVIRALYCIHGRQTASEQAGALTKEVNGVGFNRHDAPLLTDFVRQLNSGRSLSAKQLSITRNKVKRYWRQLVEVANAAVQAQAVEAPALPATPQPAYNASVSPDRGGYRRLDPRCLCENFDGERKCDWCEDRHFDALIQEEERAEEARRMAHKLGTW